MSSQFVHNFLRICAIPQLMLIVRALSPDITLAATKLMDLCVRNTFITATHTEDIFTASLGNMQRMLVNSNSHASAWGSKASKPWPH